jgi:hypothetical protein
VKGDTANFTFTGTGVYLFGALRVNHGDFTVTVDGTTVTGSGFADPIAFQQPLFGQGNLPYGTHHVVLENAFVNDLIFVDLDYIMITTGDGSAGCDFRLSLDIASPALNMSLARCPMT